MPFEAGHETGVAEADADADAVELVVEEAGWEEVTLELMVLEEDEVFWLSLAPHMFGELAASPRVLFR